MSNPLPSRAAFHTSKNTATIKAWMSILFTLFGRCQYPFRNTADGNAAIPTLSLCAFRISYGLMLAVPSIPHRSVQPQSVRTVTCKHENCTFFAT